MNRNKVSGFNSESSIAKETSNIALAGVATQSSTLFGAVAGRAIDGYVDGKFSHGSVIHTGKNNATEENPWWMLKLPGDGDNLLRFHVWVLILVDRNSPKTFALFTSRWIMRCARECM